MAAAAESTTATKSLLVLGATGLTGSLVTEHALARGWRVKAFVRTPSKLPSSITSTYPETLSVHVGDLNDQAALTAAVKAARYDAIVDASSAIPIRRKGQAPQTADRSTMLHTIIEALQEGNRIADTSLIIVAGQVTPEPGGSYPNWTAWTIASLIGLFSRSAWNRLQASIELLFRQPHFTFLRMGHMELEPSKGPLRPEPTTGADAGPRGAVSYVDVADAIVDIIADDTRAWDRKACYLNYATPARTCLGL